MVLHECPRRREKQRQRAWDCHGQSRLRSHTFAGPPPCRGDDSRSTCACAVVDWPRCPVEAPPHWQRQCTATVVQATAQQILATHIAVGAMVERLELKSKLPPYLGLALNEVRTEARVDSAWKHLQAGDHTELNNEAKALFDEGRLFHPMPKAPQKTAEAADLIQQKAKVCFLDESAEDGADDEMKFSSRRRRSH